MLLISFKIKTLLIEEEKKNKKGKIKRENEKNSKTVFSY